MFIKDTGVIYRRIELNLFYNFYQLFVCKIKHLTKKNAVNFIYIKLHYKKIESLKFVVYKSFTIEQKLRVSLCIELYTLT